MSTAITLAQKQFIERNSELKSPEIAQQLGISVWTVRKWRNRIKKGVFYLHKWVVLKKVL